MLIYFISFFIMGYAFRNFKKAFLYFLLFKTILVQNLTFLSLPGIPLLTIDTFMSLFFCGLFLCNYNRYKGLECEKFPMKKPFIALTISMFLSAIFAIVGFKSAVSMFIGDSIQFLLVFMMWKFIVSKKDLLFLLKGFSILFICYAGYMFYEYSIQSNPFIKYTQSFISTDRLIDFQYDITEERGYRSQSVFDHAIGGGCNFIIIGSLIFSLLYYFRLQLDKKILYLICAILCTMCAFLTGSRGPIFFMLISYLSVINLKNPKVYKILVLVILIGFIILPLLPDTIYNIFMSIFDSSYQKRTGGSNMDMRLDQLATSIAIMQESPWVGLGQKFLNVYSGSLAQYLLGMESMWFKILTTYGMLGVVTNLYSAYYFLIKIPKQYHTIPFFFVALAYWVTNSLTSTPGIKIYLYYMVLVIFLKLADQRYKLKQVSFNRISI